MAPDEITPEITALTKGIVNGPASNEAWAKCFTFVTNELGYEHYYGCKKGALLTLLERKGNDADLSTLLVAMLRSAGYDARYKTGVVAYETSSEPNGWLMQNWLGVAVNSIPTFSESRGFPVGYANGVHRVWVEVNINGSWFSIDPAVKRRTRINPLANLAGISGYTRTALEAAAGGTLSTNAIESINVSSLGTYLSGRTAALLAYLEQNQFSTEASTLMGGWKQQPFLDGNGNQPLFIGSVTAVEPVQTYSTLPSALLTTIGMEVHSTASGSPIVATYSMPMANLQGRRLSLTFDTTTTSGKAQLWLDDTLLVSETTAAVGTKVDMKIDINHPHSNSFGATQHDQFTQKSYKRGSSYAVTYAFNPTQDLLRARQEQLDAYRRDGKADNSREVVTETLNVIGLTWLHQTELMERLVGAQTNCDPLYHHRVGRVCQENGYYIDVDIQFSSLFSLDGNGVLQDQTILPLNCYASSMEHGVIEQLQGVANPAVSTVKLLGIGNAQPSGSRRTFFANSASWAAISPQLVGYATADLTKIQSTINAGGTVLLPQKGNLVLNQWTGAGYITQLNSSGSISTQMLISGALNGGYASFPSFVDTNIVAKYSNYNPIRTNTSAYSTPAPRGLDPIDLASGDYLFEATDLSVGASSPRGIEFSRQYHGGRRWVNLTGLGYGWTHNWNVRATRRSAYEPALGQGGTPYDVASAMVAAMVSMDLATVTPDAQHLTLQAFVANWLTDQLQDNALAVSVGDRSLQFVKRADGIWQAPGGVTTTMAANGTGWLMQERHGNKYNFDSTGHLTSVVDQWGKTSSLTYNASDKVATVADAYARSLTFNYTGTNLASVSDSTGRSVSFTQNATTKDLETVTDPEGKKDQFLYDSGHRITEVRNHDGQIVGTNIYDTAGKVSEQNSQGDGANRKWKYYFGPSFAIEQNPLGARTTYYFDAKKRQVAAADAYNRTKITSYDGQDRVVFTQSPLGYTNSAVYDRFHNVLSSTDADGKTTTNTYDSQLRLATTTDPLNHTTTFTYNTQHQPLTITNALSETVTNTYNTSGTLASTADPASNTTTYGYNSRDELTSTTFPGSGGTETITRTALGDAASVQDARGNTTSSTYNLRREVLTITQPGSLVTTNTYDNQRHLASTTDPRGNTTSLLYSPTGKLLTTTLPDGSRVVDAYDVRDWKSSTTDPLNRITSYFYFDSGEMSEQRDSLNRSTYYSYDGDSRPIATTDALGHTVQTGYNGRGLVTSSIDALNQSSANAYDNAGRRTTFTNRRTSSYGFTYDNANRLLSTTSPLSRSYGQTWNNRGLVATITEPSTQGTTLTYDARGRVVTRADGSGTITYTYDNANNLLTTTQGGITTTRTYDTLNRLATYNDGRSHVLSYTYDGANNLTTLTYETGKTVTYTYDSRNRMSTITDWTGKTTRLAYDGANRLLSVARPNGTMRINTWDTAGQLTSVNDRAAGAGGLPVVAMKIGYDGAGRLTSKLELPPWPAATALPARAATYNTDNQLTAFNSQSIASDSDGNLTSAPPPTSAGTPVSYTWNTRNQLTSAPGGLTQSYDAEGMRTATTIGGQTTTYVNDPQGSLSRMLWRVRPDGTRTFYIYGPGLLYEVEETGNVARYYHYDHLGSTLALTDQTGAVTGRANYSAYGVLLQTTGTLNTPFLWQGMFGVVTDANGLLYMRARYYHAYLGRFMSEDPLGLSAGPNVYAYCGGNPVMFNDPSGLLGIGLQGSITTDVGVGPLSAGQTAAAGGGVFFNGMSKPKLGGFASWGGFGRAGNHIAQYPSADSLPESGKPWAGGLFAGGGASVFVTNANKVEDLDGPFTTININAGWAYKGAGIQVAYAGKTVVVAYGGPPAPVNGAGYGFAVSKYNTNTWTTGAKPITTASSTSRK